MTKPPMSSNPSTVNPTTPTSTSIWTEQKCNYCSGTGKWSKDIIPGRPPESVNCPHCHGSGKTGHGTIERVAPEESAAE